VPQPQAAEQRLLGPIALHGGGEFLPGDERFLDALLEAAAAAAVRRAAVGVINGEPAGAPATTAEPLRVAILPTAASRGSPDQTAAFAIEAIGKRGVATGRLLRSAVARVVDITSAEDDATVDFLASADLIYLPGGDPDLIPRLLGTTPAGWALSAAHHDGALIAGASAGAMGLAEWSWTPEGGILGLDYVHGLAVVPHYDDIRRLAWQRSLGDVAPNGIGYLGLDERTGVISNGVAWQVAGEGAAYWFGAGALAPIVARHGEHINFNA
jgi:cyanophycinase-like exopeptidase